MKFLIARLNHETNTFSPVATPLASFAPDYDDAAFQANKGMRTAMAAFIVASIVGMIIGRKLCARVPARTLQVGFASVCLVVAGYMLFRA